MSSKQETISCTEIRETRYVEDHLNFLNQSWYTAHGNLGILPTAARKASKLSSTHPSQITISHTSTSGTFLQFSTIHLASTQPYYEFGHKTLKSNSQEVICNRKSLKNGSKRSLSPSLLKENRWNAMTFNSHLCYFNLATETLRSYFNQKMNNMNRISTMTNEP